MPAPTRRKFWTAAATLWSQEERAASHVERRGFEFYLPRVRVLRESRCRHSLGEPVDVSELLFPGYVMIRVRRGWQSLMRAPGIHRLFVADETPVRVRDEDVARLRDMEDETGHVRLTPRLSRGQTVGVSEAGGAFAGQFGVVEDAAVLSRVRVAFATMLGRPAVREFDERALFAA